jgi:hypothetical protein
MAAAGDGIVFVMVDPRVVVKSLYASPTEGEVE